MEDLPPDVQKGIKNFLRNGGPDKFNNDQCSLALGVVCEMPFTVPEPRRALDALLTGMKQNDTDYGLYAEVHQRYKVLHGNSKGERLTDTGMRTLFLRTISALGAAAKGRDATFMLANGCCDNLVCPKRLFHQVVMDTISERIK